LSIFGERKGCGTKPWRLVCKNPGLEAVALAPVANFNLGMRQAVRLTAWCAALLLAAAGPASAVQVRKAGKLNVPPDQSLLVFSTDATVARVLNQDLEAAHREAGAQSGLTLSVTVTERFLKPGVSLNELAPGHADEVADLIKQAGATPPPLGDTGDKVDEAAVSRERVEHQMVPHDNPTQRLINQFEAPPGDLGPPPPCDPMAPVPGCAGPAPTPRPRPGSPGYVGDVQQYMQQGHRSAQTSGDDDNRYDTVVVARATLGTAPEEMVVVAVAHPGEDMHETKKLIAEEIANAILH